MATQPVYYPAFAFAWASLVAHRLFVPKMIGIVDDDVSCFIRVFSQDMADGIL